MIKNIRNQKNLTQLQLAIKAGVSMQAIWMYENGATPTKPTARKLADALGVQVSELYPDVELKER